MGAIDWLAGGGATTVGRYSGWDEDELDKARSQQAGARGGQDWLAGVYRDRVHGRAPSVAEQQLAEANAANKRQQLAMARSGGGGSLGQASAMRMAQMQGAQADADTARTATLARAQEQMAAEQNLGALYGQQRAQDQGMFGGEASWQQGKADIWQGGANAQAAADEQYKTRRGSGVAGMAGAVGVGIAALSDPSQKTDIAPAIGAMMQGYSAGYAGGPVPMPARQGGSAEPAPPAAQPAAAPAVTPTERDPRWSELLAKNPGAWAEQKDREFLASSDPRGKVGVWQSDATSWLEPVMPVSYRYRDPEMNASAGAMDDRGRPATPSEGAAGDRRVGVLTTDLRRTPQGSSMVVRTPRGDAIDPARATGPILAATAEQEARLRRVEAALAQSEREYAATMRGGVGDDRERAAAELDRLEREYAATMRGRR